MAQGIPPQYKGSLHCYGQIIQAEGMVGLWSAYGFNVVRNSIINAAELASYDQYKQTIIQWGWLKDGIPCHLLCASLAGLTACVIGSPVDVLTTIVMNA